MTAAVLVVGAGGLMKFSESPTFCRSCHIMEPYYEAWATSVHNKVACVECHYPPEDTGDHLWRKFQAVSQVAKFVTRTYSSKPYAVVENQACLRSGCHSEKLLEGKIVFAGGVKFDHLPHLRERRRGRQLRCVSCHSQIVVGRHVEVTLESCFLCHFKGKKDERALEPLGGCQACHILPDQDFTIANITYNHKDFVGRHGTKCQSCHLDVVEGEGNALRERCFTCHNEVDKLERFDDTAFIHDWHITKEHVACFHCHEEIRHGLDVAKKPMVADCGLCHEHMHGGAFNMYAGTGASLEGLPEMPSPMYLAQVDCAACHRKRLKNGGSDLVGQTYVASGEACDDCHDGGYGAVLEPSREELSETLDVLEQRLSVVRGSGPDRFEELDRATRDLAFVRFSQPLHNIYYASAILREANDLIDRYAGRTGADLPSMPDLPLVTGRYCLTLCHERLGVAPPEGVDLGNGVTFSHAYHLDEEGLACQDCHVIRRHKEISPRPREQVCLECHEEEEIPIPFSGGP